MPKLNKALIPTLTLVPVLAGGGWLGYCWWVNQQVIGHMDSFAQNLSTNPGNPVTLTYQTKPDYFKPGHITLTALSAVHIPEGGTTQAKLTTPGPVALNADVMAKTLTLTSQNLPLTFEIQDTSGTTVTNGQLANMTLNVTPSNTAGEQDVRFQAQNVQLSTTSTSLAIGALDFQQDSKVISTKMAGIKLETAASPSVSTTQAHSAIPSTVDVRSAEIAGLELTMTDFDETLPEQEMFIARMTGMSLTEQSGSVGKLEKFSVALNGTIRNQTMTQTIKVQSNGWTAPSSTTPQNDSLDCALGITLPLETYKTAIAEMGANDMFTEQAKLMAKMQSVPASVNLGPCTVVMPQLNGHVHIVANANKGALTSVSGTLHAQGPLVEDFAMMAASIPGAVDPSATDTVNIIISSTEDAILLNGQPMFPLPTDAFAYGGVYVDISKESPEQPQTDPQLPTTLTPTSPEAPTPAFMPMDATEPATTPTMLETAPTPLTSSPTPPETTATPTPESTPETTPTEPTPQPEKQKPKPKPKPKKPTEDPYLVKGIEDKSTR